MGLAPRVSALSQGRCRKEGFLMRRYLILTTLTVISAAAASASRTPEPPPAALVAPASPTTAQFNYVLVAQPPEPADTARLAIQSHPSFLCFIENFPGAYMRDACLRQGWDRPVTMQEPYRGDARDHLAQELNGRLIELQEAEAKWQAIREKHGVIPKSP